MTGNGTNKESKNANGKKRKRGGKDAKKGSPKRRKSDVFEDEDENMLGSDDEDLDDDIESDSDNEDDSESDNDSKDNNSDDDDDDASKSGSDSEAGDEEGEETEESLQAKIVDANDAVKAGRERLSEARKAKKDAIDYLAGLKKKESHAQKSKNAFCSLKRSEVSFASSLFHI